MFHVKQNPEKHVSQVKKYSILKLVDIELFHKRICTKSILIYTTCFTWNKFLRNMFHILKRFSYVSQGE